MFQVVRLLQKDNPEEGSAAEPIVVGRCQRHLLKLGKSGTPTLISLKGTTPSWLCSALLGLLANPTHVIFLSVPKQQEKLRHPIGSSVPKSVRPWSGQFWRNLTQIIECYRPATSANAHVCVDSTCCKLVL